MGNRYGGMGRFTKGKMEINELRRKKRGWGGGGMT